MSTPTDLHDDVAEEPDEDRPLTGSFRSQTRRTFIRGIAAAGASTVAAASGVVQIPGVPLFEADAAEAATRGPGGRGRSAFSEFSAIGPSVEDDVVIPEGFRSNVLIAWGDIFENETETLSFGFNNDFLAYFPLHGSTEGILFVNHEYPSPFFQHGFPEADPVVAKTPAQVQLEQDAVGNSFLHVRRNRYGVWEVVNGSPYNRRVYGDRPEFDFTGPRAGDTSGPIIGTIAHGSVGDCSGGITPWHTALACEENYAGYGETAEDGGYAWAQYGDSTYGPDAEYDPVAYAKYGWVCEHDPYDPEARPRKHTALGRFRHENTAFRHEPGKKFVLYSGDDKANEGLYKFVSDRSFRPGRRHRAHNLKILESGTLYVARFEPEGRRRFETAGDVTPVNATSGTGSWVEVLDSELHDTSAMLRARFADEWDQHFALNRPEDVEVAENGTVYMAMTNNSTVKDSHGAVRRLRETHNDPEAMTFTWEDFAAGGPPSGGGQGFSSPDNLTFDSARNLWVVTDISSSRLNKPNEYAYHGNNAMFMVPTKGPNAGVAFRFANMPIESEPTGPYFTPDERTLFLCVQHPGEETPNLPGARFGDPATYTSWWPEGNRTAGKDPATPKPSIVVITRVPKRR